MTQVSFYRPDKPMHMRKKQIMVTREMRDQMKVLREVEHLSWLEIGRRMGHSGKWARQTAQEIGVPTRALINPAGRRPNRMREMICQWVKAKAQTNEIVGKYAAIAYELHVSIDSVKRAIKIMQDRGEIIHTRLGPYTRRFSLPSTPTPAGD